MPRKRAYRRKNLGTPELRRRRLYDDTLEPLDLCFKAELIENHHYRAGIHLRHLRTIRFGIANIRAYDCFDLGGIYAAKYTDEKFLAEMNYKYKESTRILDEANCYNIVMSVCIYLEKPKFLKVLSLARRSLEFRLLHKGLTILSEFYEFDKQETREVYYNACNKKTACKLQAVN